MNKYIMEVENINKESLASKRYYKTFYTKHHDKLLEKNECEFCHGSYTYFTKSQHKNSLKCIKAREGIQAYLNKKLEKMRQKHVI
jgi:hypothetical protein